MPQFSFPTRAKHVLKELTALEHAKGVDNITQLVEVVPLNPELANAPAIRSSSYNLLGIVKEYIPGQTLLEGARIVGVNNARLLQHTIQTLHASEMSGLDLAPKNIVITPNGIPYLMDLGTVDIQGEESGTRQSRDMHHFEQIMRRLYLQ
jgi:tRNA A-37 threonylcarbamoyl transferase component Bud32